MDDEVFVRITGLVDEEHYLLSKASSVHPLTETDEARLRELEVHLDQCWDLLRQRRARREAGSMQASAVFGPTAIVEGYQQ